MTFKVASSCSLPLAPNKLVGGRLHKELPSLLCNPGLPRSCRKGRVGLTVRHRTTAGGT